MRSILHRFFGVLLIAGAIFGFLFSLAGITYCWKIRPVLEKEVISNTDEFNRVLGETQVLLKAVDDAFAQAETGLTSLEAMAKESAKVIDTSAPAIDSAGKIINQDFTSVIHNTQISLASIETSMKLIDDTLNLIAAIPFVGAQYKPDIPINTSIAQISVELDSLPEKLKGIGTGLQNTSASFKSLKTNIDELGKTITLFKNDLAESKRVVKGYRIVLDDLENRSVNLKDQLLLGLDVIVWGFTFLFLWMLIAQIGLFSQGTILIKNK